MAARAAFTGACVLAARAFFEAADVDSAAAVADLELLRTLFTARPVVARATGSRFETARRAGDAFFAVGIRLPSALARTGFPGVARAGFLLAGFFAAVLEVTCRIPLAMNGARSRRIWGRAPGIPAWLLKRRKIGLRRRSETADYINSGDVLP